MPPEECVQRFLVCRIAKWNGRCTLQPAEQPRSLFSYRGSSIEFVAQPRAGRFRGATGEASWNLRSSGAQEVGYLGLLLRRRTLLWHVGLLLLVSVSARSVLNTTARICGPTSAAGGGSGAPG